MLWIKVLNPGVLHLSWLAFVYKKWRERSQVLTNTSQKCYPGSIAVLGCAAQFALLFSTTAEDSLSAVNDAQEKTLLIGVICVAREDVVLLNFCTDLLLLAGNLHYYKATYKLKIHLIPRGIIGFLPCDIKAIKPTTS